MYWSMLGPVCTTRIVPICVVQQSSDHGIMTYCILCLGAFLPVLFLRLIYRLILMRTNGFGSLMIKGNQPPEVLICILPNNMHQRLFLILNDLICRNIIVFLGFLAFVGSYCINVDLLPTILHSLVLLRQNFATFVIYILIVSIISFSTTPSLNVFLHCLADQ